MEAIPISDHEKAFFQEQAKKPVRELFQRYGEIDDIFSFSPDLNSQEWHVEGKEMIHDLVVAIPTSPENQQNFIIAVSTHLTGEGPSLTRKIALHVLDMPLEKFSEYRQNSQETYRDLIANAVFEIRKQRKTNPELTTHEQIGWTVVGDGIKTDFQSSSFSTRQRFDHSSNLLQRLNTCVTNNTEHNLEFHTNTRDVMQRQAP